MPILLQATHLVGGIIELKWISGNNYQLTVRVLRDCENGNPEVYFDSPISVGIFEKNTHINPILFRARLGKRIFNHQWNRICQGQISENTGII